MASFGRRYLNVVNTRYSFSKIVYCLLLLFFSNGLYPQDIPSEYKKYFAKYVDKRSILEKSLNIAGLTNKDVGRSFALICGVSYYPNMGIMDQNLQPAEEDLQKLQNYLENYEFFDEIVVLKNADMTLENLGYFLQTYFPKRLQKFPKSRFLFAYSGHGMTQNKNSYLLKNTARNLTDKDNAINLLILKVYIDEVVSAGHHVLVLINSCYSGAFLKRTFGERTFIPKYPGAHAITAGGSGELAWHDPEMGTGSVFYEKIIAGISGIADTEPNGIITAFELASYLRREIQVFTDQLQNPQVGDISKHGSQGEFFFLNREKQVAQRIVPELEPDRRTAMGIDAEKLLKQGKEYYGAEQYHLALPLFQQSADLGNSSAMVFLGWMYLNGYGVTQDYNEAVYWYRKAVEAGDIGGMASLGYMYLNGYGVTQDYNEAVYWYRKAVEAGETQGMTMLGDMYLNGYGVTQDYNEAVYWYRKAAEAGNARGMAGLGVMYSNGYGVTQDYNEAVYWYRKAAEAGDDFGMAMLGFMYEKGYGVSKNYAEAVRWYRKAAKAGNEGSINRLKELGEDL
jgi:TPR repeat protein